MIVNAVSGGSLPTVLWHEYLRMSKSEEPTNAWPEEALLNLVVSTPKFGGPFNWHIRGRWSRAGQRWEKFLAAWWSRQQPTQKRASSMLRLGAGLTVQFLVEFLDYTFGRLWVFEDKNAWPATREFFKSGSGSPRIPLTPVEAVATATAFPVLFAGRRITSMSGADYLLKDAGIIDNLAVLPLLQTVHRSASDQAALGTVEFWFFADAGKPMAVPPGGGPNFVFRTTIVEKLGLMDRIFRLTGDLAQPHSTFAVLSLLRDYADVCVMAVGLDLRNLEESWRKPFGAPEWTPAAVPTALSCISREEALCIMIAGAQSASYALEDNKIISSDQRRAVADFFNKLR
jgi:hypothetical protein